MTTQPLGPVHVRLRAGLDLLGSDELRAVVFGLAGLAGGIAGLWIANAIRWLA